MFNSILHIALDQEDVAQRTAGNAGKTKGVAANLPTRGRAKIGSPGNERHLLLLSIGSDAHGEGWHVGLRVSSTTEARREKESKQAPGRPPAGHTESAGSREETYYRNGRFRGRGNANGMAARSGSKKRLGIPGGHTTGHSRWRYRGVSNLANQTLTPR